MKAIKIICKSELCGLGCELKRRIEGELVEDLTARYSNHTSNCFLDPRNKVRMEVER